MKTVNYEKYFSIEQQARILIRLTDNNFLDKNAEITSIDTDLVRLEILGDGVPERELVKKIGAKVSFSVSSGFGLFRCNGVLEEVSNYKNICVRFVGKVEEQQSREYFRLGVEVPLNYTVPEDQDITPVFAKWLDMRKKYGSSPAPVMSLRAGGYRVIKWLGGDDLLPRDVNLSGGGLRIKTPNYIEPGTRVLVDIFLPLTPTRVISAVGEIVRCNEIQLSWEKGTSYTIAMKFINIDEKDRESIINFVFCEQRSQLKADIERRS